MFHLETAVNTWRCFIASARGLSREDLDELEIHLTDEIDELVAHGLSQEEAFRIATRRIGDFSTLENAYQPMYWTKIRSEHRFKDELLINMSMLKNFLKIRLRNVQRQPFFSTINVLGLSIGLTSCLLIALFVRDELSYDRFHEHSDRIYRVALNLQIGDNVIQSATAPAPLGPTLLSEYPEVEQVTRMWTTAGPLRVSQGENQFIEEHFFYADSSFFDVFTFPLEQGDSRQALTDPNSVVLTASTARRYFEGKDPMGQIVTLDDGEAYEVTAIAADPPSNSHFQFDFLASLSTVERSRSPLWLSANYNTYLVLSEQTNPEAFEAKFAELIDKYVGPQINRALDMPIDAWFSQGGAYALFLQPLQSIHLHSKQDNEIEPGGDIRYVYLFSVIALMILVIAGVNFMNLAMARSSVRSREVGVRKVLGSSRKQLINQFLVESLLLSTISLLVAIVMAGALLPLFGNLTGKTLYLAELLEPWTLAAALIMSVAAGLLAGSYPAIFMSGYKPTTALKNQLSARSGSARLRQGLVVFQFIVSVVLIAGSVVVFQQLQYMQEKKLGFNEENVLLVRRAEVLGNQLEAFKSQILQHADVAHASAATTVPGARLGALVFQPDETSDATALVNVMDVDYDFVKTLDLTLAIGRDFSTEFGTDSTALILNETAVRRLGWADPIGKAMTNLDDGLPYSVIGVVEDFHFSSLQEEIQPVVLRLAPSDEPKTFIAIRAGSENLPSFITELQQTWNSFVPSQPFEYTYLSEDLDALYQSEQRTSTLMRIFAFLTIFVACLGLLGLATFSAERRIKEIGVRKALGASVTDIVLLLSKNTFLLVTVAVLVALPAAYVLTHEWLEDFAYRIEIRWWVFALVALSVLVIALATVSYQAVRAAMSDPARSLQYE